MNFLYLTVVVVSQFIPSFFDSLLDRDEGERLAIIFEQADGIEVGSAVMANGLKIGHVVQVEDMSTDANQAKGLTKVDVNIIPSAKLKSLSSEFVALKICPRFVENSTPTPVIELYSMSNAQGHTGSNNSESLHNIRGFSSFETLWASKS